MEIKIHVSRNQDSLGVFTEAQLKAAIERGSVYPSDFCWTAGMKDWSTIGRSYPHLVPAPTAPRQTPPPYPATSYQPQQASVAKSMTAPPIPAGQGQPNLIYPSGGERFGAYLLDGLFMFLMFCGAGFPMIVMAEMMMDGGGPSSSTTVESMAQLIAVVIVFFGSLLYHGIQGSSSHSSTWGQRIMGYKMVDATTGGPPQSGKVWQWAFFRSMVLSCCGCLGTLFFLPILSDARKQSSFDSWAGIVMAKK